jgi:hypothetical protein
LYGGGEASGRIIEAIIDSGVENEP